MPLMYFSHPAAFVGASIQMLLSETGGRKFHLLPRLRVKAIRFLMHTIKVKELSSIPNGSVFLGMDIEQYQTFFFICWCDLPLISVETEDYIDWFCSIKPLFYFWDTHNLITVYYPIAPLISSGPVIFSWTAPHEFCYRESNCFWKWVEVVSFFAGLGTVEWPICFLNIFAKNHQWSHLKLEFPK